MNDLFNQFRCFQNLNLLVLREDLRQGFVAKEDWEQDDEDVGHVLCPIAHGWCHRPSEKDIRFAKANEFTNWWDTIGSPVYLIAAIDEILKERFEDADVVQSVLQEEPQCV